MVLLSPKVMVTGLEIALKLVNQLQLDVMVRETPESRIQTWFRLLPWGIPVIACSRWRVCLNELESSDLLSARATLANALGVVPFALACSRANLRHAVSS